MVLPKISEEFLTRMMDGKPIERVHVKVEAGEFGYGFE
jgi:type VI secretion system protein VasG